jgi:phage shock protein PspC (stress-responsive transcriptional regulator)
MSFQLDKENKVIAGVASGLAKDLKINPLLPRLGFVFLALCASGGVWLYIILWILMAINNNKE